MIDTILYKNKHYPKFQTLGNAAQFAIPYALHVCKGEGVDIGCSKVEWAFPGARPIDLNFDDNYDAVGVVSPKPGRAVFFDGFKLHRAGSVNSLYMKDYRFTLAYKLHHEDDDKKTTEMVNEKKETGQI